MSLDAFVPYLHIASDPLISKRNHTAWSSSKYNCCCLLWRFYNFRLL